MIFNDDIVADEKDDHKQPNAYRVDDGENIEEKDLERNLFFGSGEKSHAHPTEGTGEGGQNFGKDNLTPAGDDKNNPSQNAGNGNAYFARTEPSEEHPEDSNFTAEYQDGAPKPEKTERGNGENDRPHPQEEYSEGTADNDGDAEPNIPGPNELPDQQKVGEDNEN
jgi:hypothetical protein